MRTTAIRLVGRNGIWGFGILCLLVLGLWANESKTESDWPWWRGHGNDAVVNGLDLFQGHENFGFRIRWKKPLGSGYSGVSVAGGMAVTMFESGGQDYMIAYDAASGVERWRYRIGDTHLGRFGSADGPISTPLIGNGMVFGLGPNGHLFALDVYSGKVRWAHHLVEDMAVTPPQIYGFTTSPVRFENTLIVPGSYADGSAVCAFDMESGKVLWKAGKDSVDFQSAVLTTLNGRTQVLVPGTTRLYGIDPQTGTVLWEYQHSQQPSFSSRNLNPIALGDNRIYVKKLNGKFKAIEITENESGFSVAETWETRDLQRSYVVPVLHQENFYGLNGRFFSCFSRETGEALWKSREPGDGFPILLDGHLVTLTKNGILHLGKASPEGYADLTSIKVFKDLAWTPPSFAGGVVFVRSHGEIAAVEIVPDFSNTLAETQTVGRLPGSAFDDWVISVEKAAGKKEMIDAFLAKQARFPIIDGTSVHFIYRGEADEMAMTSEQIGARMDHPMHRIAGTDFFHYSAQLERDANITYKYLRNTVEWIDDSLNSSTVEIWPGHFSSVLNMPEWQEPGYLREAAGPAGRVEKVAFHSEKYDTLRMDIYLPPGYDPDGERRYPVAYQINGRGAQELGLMNRTLDNLGGATIEPTIVVYVHPRYGGWYIEYVGDYRDRFLDFLTGEIIPYVDANYRTDANPASRAALGTEDGAFMALYAAHKVPGTFGKLGLQSATWGELEKTLVEPFLKGAAAMPLEIYLDWGTYDYISPQEGSDVPEDNRRLAAFLREAGYRISGKEHHQGSGWNCWRNRTGLMLTALFPKK